MRRPAGPTPSDSYEGQFLIAMPSLRDGPFARSVVYMCAHRADGAMGIVDQPARRSDVQFAELLVQLEIVRQADAIRLPPSVGSRARVARRTRRYRARFRAAQQRLSLGRIRPSRSPTASV